MRRSGSTPRRLTGLLLGLLLAGAAPVGAQTLADYDYDQLSFRGLGLGAGYLWSDRIEDTEHFSIRMDLGYLGPGVRIVPAVSYWSSQLAESEIRELATQLSLRTGTVIPPETLGPIEWSDISLSVDGHFVWSTPFGVLTYVGLGFGVHALNGQGPAVDDTFVEDLLDDFTAGANGMVGIEIEPVDRLRFYVEGRYTAMSSLLYGGVLAGVQVMFSQGNAEVGAVAPPPAVAP